MQKIKRSKDSIGLDQFYKIYFEEKDTIEIAIKLIFELRLMSYYDEREIIKKLYSQIPLKAISDFRLLNENEWQKIDLPSNFKFLLKLLLNHSLCLTGLQKLETEFNNGEKIDLYNYNRKIEYLTRMGYNRIKSFEALLITSKESISETVKFLDKSTADQHYYKQCTLSNEKFINPNCHHSYKNSLLVPPKQINRWFETPEIKIETVLLELKKRLLSEMCKTHHLETIYNENQRNRKINIYNSFLRGLLADGKFNEQKRVILKKYRRHNSITKAEHLKALQLMGYTPGVLRKLYSEEFHSVGEDNCLICYEKPKSHIVISENYCLHFCVCNDCALSIIRNSKSPKCPVCLESVVRFQEIFFD